MDNPSTVIGLILHFRTPEQTLSCLHSLYSEGVYDIVVVDNSEDDGKSLSSISHELTYLESQSVRVKSLSPSENQGFAGGVACGIEFILKNLSGDVLLINSDAKLCKGALNLMRKELDRVSIVAPREKAPDGLKSTSLISFYHPALALISKKPLPGSIMHPSGCCLLIQQSLICKDFFDRDFFFYGEDAMLGFQLHQNHIKVAESEKALILHAGSASAKNGSIFYEYHMNRAHWLLATKMAGNPIEHITYIAARCVTLPLRALVRTLRFQSLTPLNGFFLATADVIGGRYKKLTPRLDK